MPCTKCAVTECSNSKRRNEDLSFHRFPSDKPIRKQWIVTCKRQDLFNPNTSHVCNNHFDSAEDLEQDLKSILMNLASKRLLKSGVMPHKNLPRSELTEGTMKPKSEAAEKRRKTLRK